MSGITPLLDTLLHQVLGKRVDVPVQRDLNEPVRPTDPSRAPRAVHSDSRLDSRQPGLQGLGGAAARDEGARLPGTSLPGAGAPASTHTHFSPAARTIADILVKFPAPPSTLRPAAPLVTASPATNVSAAQLSSQLQSSINHSGLFYESHLGRWFRGELPRQTLEAQPQMQLGQAGRAQVATTSAPAAMPPVAPAVTSLLQWPAPPVSPRGTLVFSGPFVPLGAAGMPLGSGLGSQQAQGVPPGGSSPAASIPLSMMSSASPTYAMPSPLPSTSTPSMALPVQAAAAFAAQAAESADGPVVRSQGALTESANELLQGLIRHQLEVLVTPVLRWEGDVWSGIFMALMIQLPDERQRAASGEEEGAGRDDEDAWHSTLSLSLPALGEIHVDLRLKGERVTLTLESAYLEVVEQLDQGKEVLRERLSARGFQVALLARLSIEEGGRHE